MHDCLLQPSAGASPWMMQWACKEASSQRLEDNAIFLLNSCVTEPKAKGFCEEDDKLEKKGD